MIEIEKNANKNVFKLLIGNKSDLESQRQVQFDEGKAFAESNGMKFIETSAKTDQKVKEAFETLTKEIIKDNLNKNKPLSDEEKHKIKLNSNTTDINKTKKNGCC